MVMQRKEAGGNKDAQSIFSSIKLGKIGQRQRREKVSGTLGSGREEEGETL